MLRLLANIKASPAENFPRKTQSAIQALVEEYLARKDRGARDLLVKRIQPLVRNTAGKIKRRFATALEYSDLVAAGNTALLRNLKQYDPDKGTLFITYILPRLYGGMIDEVRRYGTSVGHIPRYVLDNIRHINETEEWLIGLLGRQPKDNEIAAHLNLAPEEIHRVKNQARNMWPLILSGGESAEPGDKPLDPLDNAPDERSYRAAAALDEEIASTIKDFSMRRYRGNAERNNRILYNYFNLRHEPLRSGTKATISCGAIARTEHLSEATVAIIVNEYKKYMRGHYTRDDFWPD
ncbi:MAG: hypothetical protein LBD99_02520 [Candidatus Margulisbacteria bacterium]|jgi:DNA-directed RNA polymerase specialized sigma subunit|nr:hypothetical protein [Candidatus Margulisiibacteriota bacterium]